MLDYLPVELILALLHGSAITDILNLSRTSSLFRDIALTHRRLWLDASDSYRIRLPLGETLKTTDLTKILYHVARSAAILYKFDHPNHTRPVSPVRVSEATRLYRLPSWAFWSPIRYSQRTFIGHFPPTFMNVLPGGHSFLFGSMAHLGVYDVQGEYGIALDVPFCGRFDPRAGDTTLTVDWDSVDNGAHIAVAVISKGFNRLHDVESYLSVFAVNHTPGATMPCICRTHVFPLPLDASAVSIKGSFVLVRSSDSVVLFNLKSEERGWWLLDADCNLTAATIDPVGRTLSVVVDSRKSGMRSLQSIDIPVSMEPITPELDPFWTCLRFIPRSVCILSKAPHSCYSTWPTTQSLDIDSVLQEAPLSPDWHLHISRGSATSKTSLSTLRASYHTLRAAVRQSKLAVLRAEEEGWRTGQVAEKFLEVSLPAERMPAVGRTVAFDDVYGIALTFEQGRLFVVQY